MNVHRSPNNICSIEVLLDLSDPNHDQPEASIDSSSETDRNQIVQSIFGVTTK